MNNTETANKGKRWGAAAGMVCLAVLVTAASVLICWHSNQTIELKVGIFSGSNWEVPTGKSYAIVEDVIARFEAGHPGVKVTYVSGIMKRDYSEWLAEQALLGEAPDVFFVLPEDFNLLASKGVLEKLDSRMGKEKGFDAERYYKGALSSGQTAGAQYALPYESVPTLMFVNKTLLKKEGISLPGNDWTWEEFYDICRRVTKDRDGNGVIDQFGCYDYTWQHALCANGLTLFSEDGKSCHLGEERAEQAIGFVKDLLDLNQNYAVTSKEFDMGQVAFRPFAFSEYRTYMPYPWRIKKYSDFEWDCIRMPAGPKGGNISELDTLMMGMNARSSKKELSWELLKAFCYDEETQRQLFSDSQGVSVLKDVTESPEVMAVLGEDTPGVSKVDMTLLGQVMKECVVISRFPKYEEAMVLADNGIHRILNGQESMDNGLLVLQREINNYLRN